jgi:hypothetical protein
MEANVARDNFGSFTRNFYKNTPTTDTGQRRERDNEFTEKRKIAKHLHDQGIDPEKWTEAEPLPYPDQEQFQAIGLKPNDLHFEVGGRLYRWAPHLVGNDNQRRAAIAEYEGKGKRPIEELVDLAKVSARHPFNQKHEPSEEAEALVFFRKLAAQGIDPVRAHLGDPLPRAQQEKLRGIEGIPGVYRHPKDGHLYLKNQATEEDAEVADIRRRAAIAAGPEEAARRILETEDATSAEAEAELVAQHHLKAWRQRRQTAPETKSAAGTIAPSAPQGIASLTGVPTTHTREDRAAAEISAAAPVEITPAADEGKSVPVADFIAAVEKAKADKPLSPEEATLIAGIASSLATLDIPFDPKTFDLGPLKQSAAAAARGLAGAAKTAAPAVGAAAGTIVRLGAAAAGPLSFVLLPLTPVFLARALGHLPPRPDLAGQTFGRAPLPSEQAWKAMQEKAKAGADIAANANAVTIATANNVEPESAEVRNRTVTLSPAILPRPANDPGPIGHREDDDLGTDANEPASLKRGQRLSLPTDNKNIMLGEAEIDTIEIFGRPLFTSDPRGKEETKRRVDKLKQLVRDKLIECGMEESDVWGGQNDDIPTKRDKERYVPRGEKGVKGSRRADLSFRIRWRGKTYIVDINTVDSFKDGTPTHRESRAARDLIANRFIRLRLKKEDQNLKIDEQTGKVGTLDKGKGKSDDEWEEEARKWVDDFLDCDAPLDVDVYEEEDDERIEPDK